MASRAVEVHRRARADARAGAQPEGLRGCGVQPEARRVAHHRRLEAHVVLRFDPLHRLQAVSPVASATCCATSAGSHGVTLSRVKVSRSSIHCCRRAGETVARLQGVTASGGASCRNRTLRRKEREHAASELPGPVLGGLPRPGPQPAYDVLSNHCRDPHSGGVGECLRETWQWSSGRQTTVVAAGAGGLLFFGPLLMVVFRQKYPRWWFDWNLELQRFITAAERSWR